MIRATSSKGVSSRTSTTGSTMISLTFIVSPPCSFYSTVPLRTPPTSPNSRWGDEGYEPLTAPRAAPILPAECEEGRSPPEAGCFMPVIVVVGGQWGDEGKGRIVDLLAQKAQVVARYSAGANAGHTVVNEAGEFALHLVPAGIFYPEKVCVIGNGVVVDPTGLLKEIEGLESRGISVKGRLFLSDRAQG